MNENQTPVNSGQGSNAQNKHFKLPSGRVASICSNRIIKHLLEIGEVLDRSTPMQRLELSGTNKIREICEPYRNPLEYISQLRYLNPPDCIVSIAVDEARVSGMGSAPTYYYLQPEKRQIWIRALEELGVNHEKES